MTEEITNSITDLESALHEDAGCAAYTVKTFAFPSSLSTTANITWLEAHTNLIGTRWSSGLWGTNAPYQGSDLSNMYVFCVSDSSRSADDFKGAGYAGLSDAQKQSRMEQGARILATRVSQGYYVGMLDHTTANMTLQEFQWILNELVKYRSPYNIKISSYANIINEIKTSGSWTDVGSGVWTRTFTGTDDYHLMGMSPLINAGVDVGLKTDYEGNALRGNAWDIGPYEFLSPIYIPSIPHM